MANVRRMAEQRGVDFADHAAHDDDPLLAGKELKRIEVGMRETEMVVGALTEMLSGWPFLGSLAQNDSIYYHAVEGAPFRFAATDAGGIYFAAGKDGFFDPEALVPEQRVFAIGHEILHIVLESVYWKYTHEMQGFVPVPKSARWPDGRAPYREDVWQSAEDARINAALIADNVGQPTPGFISHFKVTFETPFGEAYAIMFPPDPPPSPQQQPQPGQQPPQPQGGQGQPPPAPPQQPQGGQGQPGQGQPQPNPAHDVLEPGQGGDAGSGDDDASTPGDAAEAASKLEQTMADREAMVNRAASVARKAGFASSNIERLVKQARSPDVDWNSYMRGFIARSAGNSAYDMTRPAMRPLMRPLYGEQAYFAPKRAGYGCEEVWFAGDTSGSVSEAEHRVMLATIASMLDIVKPRRFGIIWCDSAVQRVDEDVDRDTDFSNYNVPRGGGTSFIPVFDSLAEKGIKPDALLYFTDMHGPAPAADPGYPVLWLHTIKSKTDPDSGGKWGERVFIPAHELVRG